MKRIIRLTESDLTRIVRRVIREEAETPIGMCKVIKGGYPLLHEPNLNLGPENNVGGGEEGKQVFTVNNEQFPFYGTSGKFSKIEKNGGKGYTLSQYVNCKMNA
jgi:hypothetical protein